MLSKQQVPSRLSCCRKFVRPPAGERFTIFLVVEPGHCADRPRGGPPFRIQGASSLPTGGGSYGPCSTDPRAAAADLGWLLTIAQLDEHASPLFPLAPRGRSLPVTWSSICSGIPPTDVATTTEPTACANTGRRFEPHGCRAAMFAAGISRRWQPVWPASRKQEQLQRPRQLPVPPFPPFQIAIPQPPPLRALPLCSRPCTCGGGSQ